MRLNRIAAVPVVAVMATGALTACNDKDSKTASDATSTTTTQSAATSDSAAATDSASASGSASDSSCPTSNERKFAKTRFTADIGFAAGTFHRWIYKPYQKGSFTKGHIDKSDALKAAGAAALDYKLLKNAAENAKANPTLCKAVAKPLSDAMDKIKDVNAKQLLMGNVAGLAGAESALSGVLSGSKSTGNDISENDSLDGARKALSDN